MGKITKKAVVGNITDKLEKLELLMNKVVEFNKPNILYCKGFLYKDYEGYYIKVVETIVGSLSLNSKIYLQTGDDAYIVQAEKPKLMRVSMKSWHYRLVKYVLGSNAPTPKTMQNGCPYFWLLIFSVLVVPFKVIGEVIYSLIMLFPRILIWSLEKFINSWLLSIEEEEVYEYYYRGNLKLPTTAKFYLKNKDTDILNYFLLEKYGLEYGTNQKEYLGKRKELELKWNAWSTQINAKKREDYQKRLLKQREIERKEAIKKEKWDARMKPINNALNKLIDFFVDAFTFDLDWKNIIRRTKQFVGGLITLFFLTASFFIVNLIAHLLTIVIDWSATNWLLYVYVLAGLSIVGIAYLIGFFIIGFGQKIVNKYKTGKKVWYVEPLIWLYYPIKYVALGIAYSFLYILIKPAIWFAMKIIVPLALAVWRGLCAIGRGIYGSTGIFGEYFSASYTDYCPGLEWADTDDEK
jgi:hypothetical protein